MKYEEAIKKVLRTFSDEEDESLLRLALLKERADYRKFFTVAQRAAVESACSRVEKENAKGPGHFTEEETYDIIADFLGELRHRFCIQGLTIPRRLTPTGWLDVLDPLVDVGKIPAEV
ncbi:MAG TPA: hypothetical protein VJ386_02550, partial [Candidatus Deferrimicrobiaceae bacterium]|nr:hypothetical protein [Candidatus Deferrimicrobiaceae bacterium]